MRRNKERIKKCADALIRGFVWKKTPEGHNFWEEVHMKLLALLDDENKPRDIANINASPTQNPEGHNFRKEVHMKIESGPNRKWSEKEKSVIAGHANKLGIVNVKAVRRDLPHRTIAAIQRAAHLLGYGTTTSKRKKGVKATGENRDRLEFVGSRARILMRSNKSLSRSDAYKMANAEWNSLRCV